jgi:uncharacterized protein (TIGR02284 family)
MLNEKDANLEPQGGEPAAAAGVLGGAAAGGLAGAAVGGMAGKAGAVYVNFTVEEAYWRENYERESYFEEGHSFEDYGPAYALGWSSGTQYGTEFDAIEPELARQWESKRGHSSLAWPHARHAARAAWLRVNDEVDDAAVPLDNDKVIDILNELLETCRDGEYSFNACAEHTSTPNLKAVFEQRSKDCTAAALELFEQVVRLGGKPEGGGSASGAVHRGWAAVRGVLTGHSDYSLLDESERGEDMALAHYRKALKETLPSNIRALVQRQMQGAQRNHDQIKALRDEAKEKPSR